MRIAKAQTSLCIRSLISVSVIRLLHSIISKLALYKLAIFLQVSVDDQTGLSRTWSGIPKTVLLLWIFYVFFCLVFAMPLCASVYLCLVVTC